VFGMNEAVVVGRAGPSFRKKSQIIRVGELWPFALSEGSMRKAGISHCGF